MRESHSLIQMLHSDHVLATLGLIHGSQTMSVHPRHVVHVLCRLVPLVVVSSAHQTERPSPVNNCLMITHLDMTLIALASHVLEHAGAHEW